MIKKTEKNATHHNTTNSQPIVQNRQNPKPKIEEEDQIETLEEFTDQNMKMSTGLHAYLQNVKPGKASKKQGQKQKSEKEMKGLIPNLFKLSNLKTSIPLNDHFAEFEKLKQQIIENNEKDLEELK